MRRNIMKNCAQVSDLDGVVSGDGDVVFRALFPASQPKVAARLPRDFIAVPAEHASQIFSADVTRQLQAGMTSSFTRCRRMTLGLSSSPKWQRTASRSDRLS
jgi:hypothetical protein